MGVALAVTFLFVSMIPAGAAVGPPRFIVETNGWNKVEGYGWVAPVTVFVRPGGGSEQTLGSVEVDAWGNFGISFDGFYDFQTGDVVRVTDGTNEKQLILTPLGVTKVNMFGTLQGICDPSLPSGADIPVPNSVWVAAENWNEGQSLLCAGGVFDASGLFDMSHGRQGSIGQSDADGDRVRSPWWFNLPMFQVTLNGMGVYGENWAGPTAEITITHDGLDDVVIPAIPVGEDGSINEWFSYEFQVADTVRVEDSNGNIKELLLTPIEVTDVDVLTDTLSGTCTSQVSETVTIWEGPTNTFLDEPCTGDAFAFAGSELFDIPDTYDPEYWGGWVGQTDGDGDQVNWWWDPAYGFTFAGFLAPIDNDQPNSAKAGQAIPVKWRLLDSSGGFVSDPVSFVNIAWEPSSEACAGATPDAIETYASSTGVAPQYIGDGYWLFNAKTSKGFKGCLTMTLTLSDGYTYAAAFTFK